MAEVEYRVAVGGEYVGRDELDRIEEVVVEQEVDMAWEARLQVPVRVDDEGNWRDDDIAFMEAFERVRVEVRVGGDEGSFVPLIDGPVVDFDHDRSAEPGRSTVVVVVQDDSVYLNREDGHEPFDGMSSFEQLVRALFDTAEQIAATEIELPSDAGSPPERLIQQGSPMQMLRGLARSQDAHVNVLPGPDPGDSIGVFRPFPTEGGGDLPPLVLLGRDRNMESFGARQDAQAPTRATAWSLDPETKEITSATAGPEDGDRLGPELPFEAPGTTGMRIVRPGPCGTLGPERRAAVEAQRSAWALEAEGTVMTDCYGAVLTPYAIVTVKGAGPRQSGDWVVRRVTHTLGRSTYTQAFQLKRNAVSNGDQGDSVAAAAAGIA
ncbi:MAG: hypothetical protein ACODAE_02965 [Gemmatimonadota bacterium]